MNATVISFLAAILAAVATVAEPAPPMAEETSTTGALLVAIALLAAALALAALEFVVVSGGLLGIGAIGCAIAAVSYAFAAGPLAGWVFTVLTPLLGIIVFKSGLQWIRRSPLVIKDEITSDAGYHHAFTGSGIGPGSTGTLVTDAFPSGRARFSGSAGSVEIDVQIRGGTGARGEAVTIIAIDGPVVTCRIPSAAPVSAPLTAPEIDSASQPLSDTPSIKGPLA